MTPYVKADSIRLTPSHRGIDVRRSRNWPSGMASTSPKIDGSALNSPSWNGVAPNRARKTPRNGAAAAVNPTAMASRWTIP